MDLKDFIVVFVLLFIFLILFLELISVLFFSFVIDNFVRVLVLLVMIFLVVVLLVLLNLKILFVCCLLEIKCCLLLVFIFNFGVVIVMFVVLGFSVFVEDIVLVWRMGVRLEEFLILIGVESGKLCFIFI